MTHFYLIYLEQSIVSTNINIFRIVLPAIINKLFTVLHVDIRFYQNFEIQKCPADSPSLVLKTLQLSHTIVFRIKK